MSSSINDIDSLHITRSVSWAKKPISIRRTPAKGVIPKQLVGFQFGSQPKECAESTKGLKGAERVKAMNACVRAKIVKE